MGFLGDAVKKVGGGYKKAFGLYKTPEGQAGLGLGCGFIGGPSAGAACSLAANDLFGKKGSKLKAKQDAVSDSSEPAGPSPLATGLVVGGVVLVALVALGAASK